MRVAIFTCGRDAGLAELATKTIPADWDVAWVVDGRDAGLVAPRGVEVVEAPFNRGQTLNGDAACLGVARFLAGEAERFGRVAKVDSDCLLVQPDFLLAGELAGMRHKAKAGAVYGLAYAMGQTAARNALWGILEAIAAGSRLGGEDEEVTSRACAGGGILPIGSFWQSRQDGKTPPPGCKAIHCGILAKGGRDQQATRRDMQRLGDLLGLWRR